MKKIFIHILFFVLCISYLNAQPNHLKFNYITNLDGLSQNSGRAIIQDSRGFIWIATELGLNRFDGYNFIIYNRKSSMDYSLSNIYINTLFEDSHGNILIGNDAGLDYLDIKTDKITHYLYDPESTDNIFVYAIYEDSENIIWAGTSKGLYKINIEKKTSEHQPYNIELKYSSITDIIEQEPGIILISTFSGLLRFNIKKQQFNLLENSPKAIRRIINDSNNQFLLLSFQQGITTYIASQDTFINNQNTDNKILQLSNNNLSEIIKDEKNNLWITTFDSGLIYFDRQNNKFSRYQHNKNLPNTISSNSLFSVFLDDAGILWVGTLYNGVNYYDTKHKPFNHIFADNNNNRIKSIGAILQDKNKNIWLSTFQGAIKYNLADNSTINYQYSKNKNSITGNSITCIAEDKEGLIWFGTDMNGLSCYNPENNKFTNYFPNKNDSNSIAGSSIWAIDVDINDNIWLGFWGDGVDCYNKSTKIFTHYIHQPNDSNSLSVNQINTIRTATDGKIWIGTWEGGLNVLNPETNKFEIFKYEQNNENSISLNNIMTLTFDSDSNLWIGTFGAGLCKYNPATNKFTRYSQKDGLPSNTIQGILEDAENNLWISSSNGLSKYIKKDNIFKNYDIYDGIQSNDFSQHGYFKTIEGKFLFAGSNGFNFFQPDSIKNSKYAPKIIISNFKISNKKVFVKDSSILSKQIFLTDTIILNYAQRDISFEFSALHFAKPNKILYAYKLDGYDKEWNYTDASFRYANYTNLNPGKYTLQIKATNCDQVWTSEIKILKIIIIPPFYKTVWFYIIVIISAILLLFFIIKFREYKLRKDKETLQKEVKLRTSEIEQQKEEILTQNEILYQKNEEINAQKDEIEVQRDEAKKQKQEIISSITYAERIQRAVLPSEHMVKEILHEHFVFFKPRDIVSGDFYWLKQIKNFTIVATVDCTGHGVPGAFMSMLGTSFLNEIVTLNSLDNASEILNKLRLMVKKSLRQHESKSKDGMDIAFYIINKDTLELQFSGAYNPLYIIRNEESQPSKTLITLKADRQPISIYLREKDFTNQKFQLKKDDCLYTFSDGFADQFGGEEGGKFKIKKFKELLLSIANKPMQEQKQIIDKTFNDWISFTEKDGHIYEQIDDVLVVGVRI